MANIVSVGEQDQSSANGIASFKQVGSLGVQASWGSGINNIISASTTLPITAFHALKVLCRKVNTTSGEVSVSIGSTTTSSNFIFQPSETNVTYSVVLFPYAVLHTSNYCQYLLQSNSTASLSIQINNNALSNPIQCYIDAPAILQFTFLFYEMT